MAFTKDALAGGAFWKGTIAPLFGNTSSTAAFTALAGGANSASTPTLTAATYTTITVCATGADSARLPVAEVGDEFFVANKGAAACAIFPQTGGTINGGSANASVSLTNAKMGFFKNIGGDNWIFGMFA